MSARCKDIFQGRIISVALEEHALPDGREATYEMVRHPGGAAALPVLDDGRVILIRQFRPAAGGMIWEIPAGRLEPDEDPAECIRRELQEEIGYCPGTLKPLADMFSAVGFCDERVFLFLATELTVVPRALESDEFIEPVTMPLAEALELLDRGEIVDAKTQLALLLADRRR
ncbi:ADP-ribose pyrophosphatase [Syntrophotalea carbinolica DSM 2380]|uniref:GDP-mannose pyrophosphatase n=1 Tax=Syntrophotalea carbinolica (strain DSM 2380 / NBRC 103641 / GraBd1) TaxID=338963 RepID=Q3A7H0_SYNC1|nr:NUDIX hydrolase [Syntrophotalea carbinolica]ABA87674.1 ADP-ribose pyrophosphatase [Syntrophotalea carbinolica DSM 2380]